MDASIVIVNYNYARFVGAAIESALAQTHGSVEVVVVDNGSTDDSMAVIQAYGERVRLVRRSVNIGQGEGFNLGFAAARGRWVLWLDADDLLDPGCIERCLALAGPRTAKVQFPLRTVDAEGRPLGSVVPFLRHRGDVTPIIRRFGHYAGPPGSGNLYRRDAVAPYFPVPAADWPICTDTVPFITAPFHGDVVDSGEPLGSYRLHGRADPSAPGYVGNFNVSMAQEVRLNAGVRDRSLALLRERSGIEVAGPFLTMPTHVRYRITSWRLARSQHPFPQDTAGSLWRLMRASLRAWPGYTPLERLLMSAWAAGALTLPAAAASTLMATRRTQPLWSRLLAWSRRTPA
jgi:hypothetical protein